MIYLAFVLSIILNVISYVYIKKVEKENKALRGVKK